MRKTILKLLMGFVLLIATQACTSLGPSTPDPDRIKTAIAETAAAALTQTAQPGIPVTGPETSTPTATATQPASSTPFPTFTAVSGVPQVSVSVPTNCRMGPGTAYTRVGALLVDEVAEVVGRSADGRNYWIIRNPDRPGELCWLWGEFATQTGITGALPAFTPPPTPTPPPTQTPSVTPTPSASFTASYSNLESCTGTGWWVDIQLRNNGNINFQSMSMIVRDTTNDTVVTLYSENFTDRNGCNESNTWDSLPADATRIVSPSAFTYDPAGNELRATITLCSNAGQSGTCTTQSINFTP